METKKEISVDEIKLDGSLYVSDIPHIRSKLTTSNIMLDLIIAMVPAIIASVYFFGLRSIAVIGVSVISAVLSEYIFTKVMKKECTIKDLSAVVTGILLAFNLPVSMPLPMVAFGSVFAIIIVKELFGGLGSNFMNPALAARAVLMMSWPEAMTNFTGPMTDMVATATPLSGGEAVSIANAFFGNMPGSLGEVSKICLLIGAAYLLFKGIIRLTIPVTYIAATAVTLLICGVPVNELLMHILTGGLILGAFFMATDYVTAPVSKKAQVIFAIGCGVLTAVIRVFGSMPEGVSFSILIMNVITPFLEKVMVPKPFGVGGAKK